jgi:predicted Holliday junction resolvase-like endonuclease
MEAVHLFFAGMIGLAVGALFMWVRMKLRWRDDLRDACNRSVSLSRSTIKGQIGEQLAPLLAGFTYAAADARFLGDPIDYVIFNGYTDARDADGGADEIEVVLLDIKRGRSRLSATQRAIAAAVRAGRVRFEVVRIADNGEVFVEEPR